MLHTAVSYNQQNIVCFRHKTNSRGIFYGYNNGFVVNCSVVVLAMKLENLVKDKSKQGLCSDHFIYACDPLAAYLLFFFVYLYKALFWIIHVRLHILKRATNYRGISLSCIFQRLFDLTGLSGFNYKLNTRHLV